MAQGVFTPYSGIEALIQTPPSWVPQLDQSRIASYQIYEEIYWTHSETFKMVLRGDEGNPIYLPTARSIVETINRYTGKDPRIAADPLLGTPEQRTLLDASFGALFKRERFYSTYAMNKRYGIMRGDWLFHVTADETKLPGTRISIRAIDPASYFTVPDPENEERIWKVHIAEPIVDAEGNQRVRRQTYMKDAVSGVISYSIMDFEVDKWAKADDPAERDEATEVLVPWTALDNRITAFPVYHIPNFEEPGNPYGSSEIRGFEALLKGLNQGTTDEDIALALEGLGLYTTDGAGPVDEDTGEDIDWVIGPGRVVENAPGFKRVNGIQSVAPYQDHLKWLKDNLTEASVTKEALNIDVAVAQSGIALSLRMGPLLERAQEKDLIIEGIINQMMFDLSQMWYPVYEQTDFGTYDPLNPTSAAVPVITFGDKMPHNRPEEVTLWTALCTTDPPIASVQTAREELAKRGFTFAADEEARIEAQLQAATERSVAADPFAARANAELAGQNGDQGAPVNAS